MLPSAMPAAAAATLALFLSALIVAADSRRPLNRLWAGVLLLTCLWQASITFAHWTSPAAFVRFALFFGAVGVCALSLLEETIATPWKSIRSSLWHIRFQVAFLPIFVLAFTRWYLPLHRPHQHNPIFWTLNGTVILWCVGLVVRGIHLTRKRKIVGAARNDMLAFVVLAGAMAAAAAVTFFSRYVLGSPIGPWLAPLLVVGALGIVAWMTVCQEIVDLKDFRRGAISWGLRGAICFAIGVGTIFIVSQVGIDAGPKRLAYALVLTLVLLCLPVFDGWMRGILDRRFASRNFATAGAAISPLVENAQASDLPDRFRDVLRRWSDGSPQVFLSGAGSVAPWPPERVLARLLPLATERGWITPEILDRGGSFGREALDEMIEHQVAAVVSFIAGSGDRLTAVFQTRTSLRPFVTRELKEARQLLRMMQLGFAVVHLRQKLRGHERLNLYSQYVPRLVSQLRRGLMHQRQLLSAIAEGRWSEVSPADAKAGLAGLAQVDRLCTHFFDVGSVFNQPVARIELGQLLAEVVEQSRSQFGDDAGAEIRLIASEVESAEVFANRELFRTAVLNLVKNAVEAVSHRREERVVVVGASRRTEGVHVIVQDSGPGLPAERQEEPFRPGESEKLGGMGLGLAIARDCIEAMGGTIGIQRSGPAGTCFEITLNSV